MDIEFVTNYRDWEALVIDGQILDQEHTLSLSAIVGRLLNRVSGESPLNYKLTSFEDRPDDITEYLSQSEYRHNVKRIARSRSAEHRIVLQESARGESSSYDELNLSAKLTLYSLGLFDIDGNISTFGRDVVKYLLNVKPASDKPDKNEWETF